jgi:hypothetical protein
MSTASTSSPCGRLYLSTSHATSPGPISWRRQPGLGRQLRRDSEPGRRAGPLCSGLNHTPRGLDSQGGEVSSRSHETGQGDARILDVCFRRREAPACCTASPVE